MADPVAQRHGKAGGLEAFRPHANCMDCCAGKYDGVPQHLLRERYPASAQFDRLDRDMQQIVQHGWFEVFNIERTYAATSASRSW